MVAIAPYSDRGGFNMATEATDFATGLVALRDHLTRRWWAIGLRGALALVFATFCFLEPTTALLSLVMVYGAYSIIDAIVAMFAALSAARADRRWVLLAVEALVSLAAGVVALLMPGLTVMIFIFLIGLRAAVGGVMLLMSAAKLDEAHGRGWMVLAGASSIILAVGLFAAPMVGAVVLTWWVGSYALVFGVVLLVLAFKLRGLRKHG